MDQFIDDFHKNLRKEVSGLRATSIVYCDFILYFCLIASRAGTDIDAAINNLKEVAADKQVIIAVLYPTNDPEKTIPDTNNAIKKENTYFVDFLFNEDEGFMNCQKNKDAIKKLARYIKSKNLTSYYLQNFASTHSYQDEEQIPLNPGGQQDKSGGIVAFFRKYSIAIAFGGFVIFGTIAGLILWYSFGY
ncbi:uncharacterized protein si:ch211-271e10.2 [Danio aesculapii]|uniref:uncharacterized protein si:ch211-271e10.2 n=1 Tax=Danio aesculapii TaxID=1142201 RepID=UPI0024BFCF2E|nr:uncharacterized protein si:ch211-271e10.2 [Danio aesculapii]